MILLLVGLPGAGKTTLARALAPVLGASVLNRDDIRDAIFPVDTLDYSAQQNHIATLTLLQVAEYLLARDSARSVILDGRPMSLAFQIDEIAHIAERTGHSLRILHITAPPEVIAARLGAELSSPSVTPSLVPTDDRLTKTIAIARDFAPLLRPHLVVDATLPAEENVATIRLWLKQSRID